MDWYEEDVKKAEQERGKLNYDPKMIFYGSSSIRLWDHLYEDFKQYYPINLGFGGSTLVACNYFFDRLLKPYHPVHVTLYAADNDLGDGAKPEDVYNHFKEFMQLLDAYFPGVSFSFISIKPSIARWNIVENIRATNTLIKDYLATGADNHYYIDIFDSMLNSEGLPAVDLFDAGGLHLSEKGYEVWKEILLAHFSSILKDSIMQN